MNKYIAEHSLLTNIGAILFFSCIIGTGVCATIINDINIGISLLVFAVLGGVLMMVGLLTEM